MSSGGIHRYTGTPTTSAPTGPQRLDEPGQRLPVQLEGDPAPGDALLQQPVEHLGHRLGGRRPLLGQPGGPDRAAHLGPARQQLHPAQPVQQRLAQAPARRRPRPSRGSRWRWWRRRHRARGRSGPWSRRAVRCRRRAGRCAARARAAPAAPRRCSRAPSSSARRAAVTPTVNPASGRTAGSASGAVRSCSLCSCCCSCMVVPLRPMVCSCSVPPRLGRHRSGVRCQVHGT